MHDASPKRRTVTNKDNLFHSSGKRGVDERMVEEAALAHCNRNALEL